MAINRKPASDARLNAKIRRLFLDHLAETANVSASARTAGVTGSAVYGERRRSPAFRSDWALALAEGYPRSARQLVGRLAAQLARYLDNRWIRRYFRLLRGKAAG